MYISVSFFAVPVFADSCINQTDLELSVQLKHELLHNQHFRILMRKAAFHSKNASRVESLKNHLDNFFSDQIFGAHSDSKISGKFVWSRVTNIGVLIGGLVTENDDSGEGDHLEVGPNLGYSTGFQGIYCLDLSQLLYPHLRMQSVCTSYYGISVYAVAGIGMWTGLYNKDKGITCFRLGIGIGLHAGAAVSIF